MPFTLSTVSVCDLSEVARSVTKPIWFQLYMVRDRGFMREMMARAKSVGASAMMFTVDMPVAGSRYRDRRSGLSGAPGFGGAMRRAMQGALHPGWAWDVGVLGKPHHLGNVASTLKGKTGLEDFFGWLGANFDPSISWKDLDFIREEWKGPLILKGILDAEDAREAVKQGVDGIVVSNHGGRQLDGVPSTARALPAVVDAVRDEVVVLADGGVRSGLDVVRMLALGAKGVLLGRAWAYALAGGRQAGVSHVLQLIEAEMRVAMSLTGVTRVDQITRDILVR